MLSMSSQQREVLQTWTRFQPYLLLRSCFAYTPNPFLLPSNMHEKGRALWSWGIGWGLTWSLSNTSIFSLHTLSSLMPACTDPKNKHRIFHWLLTFLFHSALYLLFLSIYVSTFLSIIYLPTYLSIYLSIYLHIICIDIFTCFQSWDASGHGTYFSSFFLPSIHPSIHPSNQ